VLDGYYDRDKLIYAGKVGTGFGERLGREIIAKLYRNRRGDLTIRRRAAGRGARCPLGRAGPRC
jgi:hypothetical protein